MLTRDLKDNEEIEVVLRPEDMDIVAPEEGQSCRKVALGSLKVFIIIIWCSANTQEIIRCILRKISSWG